MTHNLAPNLNETDRLDVKKRAFRFLTYREDSNFDRERLKTVLRDASYELSGFSDDAQLTWLQIGAEHISGTYFPSRREVTFSALHEALEEEYKEALEDRKEWAEAHGLDPENSHPWGENVYELLQKWLAVSPYVVWRIYKDCSEYGSEILHDQIEFIVDGEGDTELMKDKIREKLEDLMNQWVKDNG